MNHCLEMIFIGFEAKHQGRPKTYKLIMTHRDVLVNYQLIFKMKSSQLDDAFSRVTFDQNPELDIQLQAANDQELDYEKAYLNLGNFLQPRGTKEIDSNRVVESIKPNSVKFMTEFRKEPPLLYNDTECLNSKPIDTALSLFPKSTSPQNITRVHFNLQPHPADQRSRTKLSIGSSLMVYFHLKQFFNKISRSNSLFQGLKQIHMIIIGDLSADVQVMQHYIKMRNQNTFRMSLYQKLISLRPQTTPTKTSINLTEMKIHSIIQLVKASINKQLDRIPVLQPESGYKIVWDYFATLARVILLIFIPLEIAYQPQILFNPENSIVTILMVVLLAFDGMLRLNTVCYVEGQAIYERMTIIKHQLRSSFIIDVVSIMPLVYFLITNQHYQPVNFLLLVFFLQISQIMRVIRQTEESAHLTKQQSAVLGLIWFLCTLLYIVHIFSCIWFINSIEDARMHRTTWINDRHMLDEDWGLQYLEAFYYATVTLMTIGYGDITPLNPKEKLLSVGFILIACIWMSYGVNKVGDIIKDIEQNSKNTKNKMRIINKYLKSRKIPFALQYKIREYLSFCWKEQDDSDIGQENSILNQLPKELKLELEQMTNGAMLKACPLLDNSFTTQFKGQLLKTIQRVFITPENWFNIALDKGENHLCYLEQGQVIFQIVNQASKNIQMQSVIKPGQFMSMNHFISEERDLLNYKSVNLSSLLIISKSNFMEVLVKHPKDYQNFCLIKDQMLYSQFSLEQTVTCLACNNSEHSFNKCPFITYIPDREVVIKKHSFSLDQVREPYIRGGKRGKNEYHAVGVKDLIKDFANYFQSDNKQYLTPLDLIYPNHEIEENIEQTTSRKLIELNPQLEESLEMRNRQPSITLPAIKEHDLEDNLLASQFEPVKEYVKPIKPYSVSRSVGLEHVFLFKPIQDSSTNVELQNNTVKRLQVPKTKTSRPLTQSQFARAPKKRSYTSMPSMPNISKVELDPDRELENNCRLQINSLHHLLLEHENHVLKKEQLQIEELYLTYQHQNFSELPDFDCQKNFEGYMVEQNIENIIPPKERISFLKLTLKEVKHFSRVVKYMLYPSLYLMKYHHRRRTSINVKKGSLTPGIVNKIIRMKFLKNSLHRKKISFGEKKLKNSQVTHHNEVSEIGSSHRLD